MTPLPPITVGNKYGRVPCAEMVDKTQMHALAPWADDQTEEASLEGSGVLPEAVSSVSSYFVNRQKTGLVHIWPQSASEGCTGGQPVGAGLAAADQSGRVIQQTGLAPALPSLVLALGLRRRGGFWVTTGSFFILVRTQDSSSVVYCFEYTPLTMSCGLGLGNQPAFALGMHRRASL